MVSTIDQKNFSYHVKMAVRVRRPLPFEYSLKADRLQVEPDAGFAK